MKTNRYRAIVLRRTNYDEADRILQVLTPEGKKSVMARGVRKEKSKLAGAIEPLGISDMVLVSGRGELATLTSARVEVHYQHIIGDYDRLQFAYEAMRLINKISEQVDDPVWFDVLSEVLAALDNFNIDLRLIQSWFYTRYATLEGHELNLNIDTEANPLVGGSTYIYDSEEQGLALASKGNITSDHIKLMRLIASKSLKTLSQIGGIGEVIGDVLLVAKEHAAIY